MFDDNYYWLRQLMVKALALIEVLRIKSCFKSEKNSCDLLVVIILWLIDKALTRINMVSIR